MTLNGCAFLFLIRNEWGKRMPKGDSSSMFETVKDHEERIGILERVDKEHEDRLKRLEDQSMKLENTILTENRDTRTTMKEQTEKLFSIVESAMGFQSDRSAQNHEFKMMKWNTLSTVFLKLSGGLLALLSSGGAIYYLIQQYFNK